MTDRVCYFLIAAFIGFCTFALSDHWGVAGPGDFPSKFTLVAAWNPRLGPGIQRDCNIIVDSWPRDGHIEPFNAPYIMQSGACAIGLYVQNPRSRAVMARESWAKVLWTTMVAIKLHVGTVRAGWSLDFPSGLQVCFFFNIHQTGNFDLYQSLEWNLKRSPFFLGRPEADMFPEVIPETTPEQWYSDLRDRLISQHFNPRLTMTAVEFTAMGAGSWGGAVPIPADCEAAISHLAIESWFIARTGITLAGPRLETDGRCTLGIYLTNPLDPITKDTRPFWRVQGMGIDIVHEATKLLRTLGNQRRGGGYVNLPNGLEICLYDQSFLDPSNVCAKMTKMRLRDCLDNRAQAMRRKLAAATETTRTTKLRSIPAATTKAAAAALRIPLGH